MKSTPMGSKIELTRGGYLLRFSKSFLYIPGAAWSSNHLQPVKQATKCGRSITQLHDNGHITRAKEPLQPTGMGGQVDHSTQPGISPIYRR